MADLSGILVLDQHAHGLMRHELLPAAPYRGFFTEACDPEQIAGHVPRTLSYRRSLREIAALLGVDPTEEAIVARRTAMGMEAYARLFVRAAGIEAAYLDDGYAPDQLEPVEWHERLFAVRRVLRLETHAERILAQVTDPGQFAGALREGLDPPPRGVVAFKSIAAYRTGLAVQPPTRSELEDAFRAHRAGAGRLTQNALIDYLIYAALEIAARHEMPVQFHTGFGDPDLDLRLATPLHLRPILEDRRFRRVPIVLLHASYPFAREAGYLAATYPQVYLDFGLAIPLLSVQGMERVLGQLLELAPTSKLMYSSDAHHIPELYYLAARRARQALGAVLERAVRDQDLTASDADEAADDILRGNARRVYRPAA